MPTARVSLAFGKKTDFDGTAQPTCVGVGHRVKQLPNRMGTAVQLVSPPTTPRRPVLYVDLNSLASACARDAARKEMCLDPGAGAAHAQHEHCGNTKIQEYRRASVSCVLCRVSCSSIFFCRSKVGPSRIHLGKLSFSQHLGCFVERGLLTAIFKVEIITTGILSRPAYRAQLSLL